MIRPEYRLGWEEEEDVTMKMENKQTKREDRATQSVDTVRLSFAKNCFN